VRRWLIILLGAVLLSLLMAQPVAVSLGAYLIRDDGAAPADAALVLAGDATGGRILRGCELARAGLVRTVYMSGPFAVYGRNEADLAIDFAVARGCDPRWFQPLYTNADSTRDEANIYVSALRSRGVKSLLLVTSAYHTRRAKAVFEKVAQGSPAIRAVAVPDAATAPERWWKTRPARKVIFMEWTKTFAEWIGL
jgi:uncharacterized SAM-binding protein YcdF (DUF218 family)